MSAKTIAKKNLPENFEVYAYTENGREIREGKSDGNTYYWVQPRHDNYWICCRTPKAALRAFAHPELYR